MSQSGTTISPSRRLFKATEAICKVCKVGSLGMKSSDALATALFFELTINNQSEPKIKLDTYSYLMFQASNIPVN